MKKKSASQSAFFNLRVLIGLLIITTGLALALLAATSFGRGTAASTADTGKAPQNYAPLTVSIDNSILPPGADCAKIHELGIDRQENMRAGLIMIACGLSEGGSLSQGSRFFGNGFSQWIRNLLPDFIGGLDVDVILPDNVAGYPHTVQSESMEWGGPNNTWV